MSSGFITESEIEERRRVRQAEWEKVRQPGQPLEAPEEEYDTRTLFERLEEQRVKKDFEYEEAHKLKNMIRGLDDDEIEFLNMVDRTKMEQEKRLRSEEEEALQQYRNKVAALKQKSLAKKIEEQASPINSSITDWPSSTGLPRNKALASIARKRAASSELLKVLTKKSTSDETSNSTNMSISEDTSIKSMSSSEDTEVNTSDNGHISCDIVKAARHGVMRETMVYPSAMRCVGILPGIGSYISDQSSDSEITSGSGSDIEGEGCSVFCTCHQEKQKNTKSSSS